MQIAVWDFVPHSRSPRIPTNNPSQEQVPRMTDSDNPFCPIEEALDELRAGRMIVLVDDQFRENEGDLVIPAEHVTPEAINFMLTHARGILCLAMSSTLCERLHLDPQTTSNTTRM